jgi:hypothetical protein
LKGAQEVKDHPWLKYYPWKELYDKKLEAPFIPKVGDNFDRKYCEAPDKIGEATRERYDNYLRQENFSVVFNNFTFINYQDSEPALNNENTTRQHQHGMTKSSSYKPSNLNINMLKNKVKIVEQHSDKPNNIYSNNYLMNSSNSTNNLMSKYTNRDSRDKKSGSLVENSQRGVNPQLMNSRGIINSKLPSINNLDKLKLAKKLSNSSSTNSIFNKNYSKQSTSSAANSANVTSSSVNYMHRKSGSTVNFNYNQ